MTHVTHFPYYPYDARARNGDNERPRHVRHKLFQLTGPWFLWERSPLRIRRQPLILYAPGALATRKRSPTLTSDNQMTPKPNLALKYRN